MWSRILVVALCLGAVWMDVNSGRVKNRWLMGFCAAGVGLRLWQVVRAGVGGAGAVVAATIADLLFGAALPFLLLFPFFLFRMIGAGDIKLFMVLGTFMGRRSILDCLFWSLIFAALLAAGKMALAGNFQERLRYLQTYTAQVLHSGVRTSYRAGSPPAALLHMAVPVLIGALLWAAGVYA